MGKLSAGRAPLWRQHGFAAAGVVLAVLVLHAATDLARVKAAAHAPGYDAGRTAHPAAATPFEQTAVVNTPTAPGFGKSEQEA